MAWSAVGSGLPSRSPSGRACSGHGSGVGVGSPPPPLHGVHLRVLRCRGSEPAHGSKILIEIAKVGDNSPVKGIVLIAIGFVVGCAQAGKQDNSRGGSET